VSLGAVAHHIFMLVPMGRGRDLANRRSAPKSMKRPCTGFMNRRTMRPCSSRPPAPAYYRIMRQRARADGKKIDFQTFGLDAVTRGCLGGTSFVFISHVGQVQPCGYLEVDSGNVRENTFRDIWENSPVFRDLRDLKKYEGKCGRCEYIRVCGGCRARAYESRATTWPKSRSVSTSPCPGPEAADRANGLSQHNLDKRHLAKHGHYRHRGRLSLGINHFRRDTLPLLGDWSPKARLSDLKTAEEPVVSLDEARALFLTGARSSLTPGRTRLPGRSHPGALNLPTSNFEENFSQVMPDIPPDSLLITYCDGESCDLSKEVAMELSGEGTRTFGSWSTDGPSGRRQICPLKAVAIAKRIGLPPTPPEQPQIVRLVGIQLGTRLVKRSTTS